MARTASWSTRRQEQRELAGALRDQGEPTWAVAAALREEYGVNARVAARMALGWSQPDAAAAWTRRWPDDPKTFKSISYWENWPSRTGYAPSLAVLDRLAQLYGCDAADLLAGWGEHRRPETEPIQDEPEQRGLGSATLAWQVRALELPELVQLITNWSGRLPEAQRRSLLLKLSTAAAFSAAPLEDHAGPPLAPPLSRLNALTGIWTSRYSYHSAGRKTELVGEHDVRMSIDEGRLVGRGGPDVAGSTLELALRLDGNVATGTWLERTSPTGYYRAAVYQGVVQLVVDPTGRSMDGQWLGVSKHFTIKSGGWSLIWTGPATTLSVPGR